MEEKFETGVYALQFMPCTMRKLQRQKNPAHVAGPVVVAIVVCSAQYILPRKSHTAFQCLADKVEICVYEV